VAHCLDEADKRLIERIAYGIMKWHNTVNCYVTCLSTVTVTRYASWACAPPCDGLIDIGDITVDVLDVGVDDEPQHNKHDQKERRFMLALLVLVLLLLLLFGDDAVVNMVLSFLLSIPPI
jgi:accessory gene regulator protein AgrB